jgi:hypothetical protein
MELDDFKAAWAAHGAVLERSLAINERLLQDSVLRKVRLALAPYIAGRAAETALGAGLLLVAGSVLGDHATEPRYAVAAGAVMVFAAAVTALSAYLLAASVTMDYGRPVMAIQGDIERFRIVEYRAITWAVLGGVVVWLPAALVLFEALTGAPALARVPLGWLAANLAFGLVVLGVGLALSRRYVERPDLGPVARRVMDAVSGRGLRRASGHLAELAAFQERDT